MKLNDFHVMLLIMLNSITELIVMVEQTLMMEINLYEACHCCLAHVVPCISRRPPIPKRLPYKTCDVDFVVNNSFFLSRNAENEYDKIVDDDKSF